MTTPDLPAEPVPQWVPPTDLDLECLALCKAINDHVEGVITTSSCCGHGRDLYRIWIHPAEMDALPPLLYWLARCHTGIEGWQARVYTDCAAAGPFFVIEGPAGAYSDAQKIADLLRDQDGDHG